MLCGWLLVCGFVFQEPAQVGYESLVEGLIDLRWMCETPRPGERTLALDAERESGKLVLEQAGGPGVVGRLWSSRRDGVVRIAVDGAAPVVEWRLEDFGAVARDEALPPDPLAGALGAGWYSMVPISFTSSVRIEFEFATPGAARAQADVRLLGEGATVEAFDAGTLKRYGPVLRRVARTITDDENPAAARTNKTAAEAKKIAEARLSPDMPNYDGRFQFPIRGSGILRYWTIKLVNVDDPAERDAVLRALVVRVDAGTDLISEVGRELFEIPLGDFFGADAGRDPYLNYLMGMREDGTFVCRLPMPYDRHLKFSFFYPTRPAVKFLLEFGADPMAPGEVPPQRLRGGWILADASNPAPFQFELPGPARLVSAAWSSESATDAAWEDAPAFAFTRGLTRPRTGAWSQVIRRDGPGRFGRYATLRQYAHDAPVAAEHATLRFAPPTHYTGAAGEARAALRLLWYGAADAGTTFGASYEPEQRARLPLPAPDFFAVPGAFEGESVPLTAMAAAASVVVEDWSALEPPVSRKEVLLFQPAAAGDQFSFAISAPVGGEYELVARLGAGPGLGGAVAFLDGKRVGEAPASAAEQRKIREIVLHRGTFLPRTYSLALRALDAAPIALDCVVLRPVKP